MYSRKHFERTEELTAIKELIDNREYYRENSEKGLSILINGTWGSGKTTFINDLYNSDEIKKNYLVYKYDAFEYDFYDNPFIPLFSSLNDQLNVDLDVNALAKLTASKAVNSILNQTYYIMNTIFKKKIGISLDGIKDKTVELKNMFDDDVYEQFKKLNKLKEKIKEKIRKKANKKPIIFIIDELDRCNPSFAIGTLEIIKYFLDIDNFVIILSLDEKQLQESVKTIYGQGMDADIYFSKFFDYKFDLNRLTFSDLLDMSDVKNFPDILDSVDHITKELNISVRDSHKIFLEFLSKYKKYSDQQNPWLKEQCVFILFMLTLKNIDLMFYNAILNKNYPVYIEVIKQNGSIDKKKYLQILSWTLENKSSIDSCLRNLTSNADKKYIDQSYLSISKEHILDNKLKNDINALNYMFWFLPQVKVGKTYMENLLEILR